MSNKKKIEKYTSIYMSVGMCFGISFGLIYDNMSIGMIIGMCIGLAIGAYKDNIIEEKMMEITRIEEIETTDDVVIFVKDQAGKEKRYEISKKKMKEEKFKVGDRVAEEYGVLVSLESKLFS